MGFLCLCIKMKFIKINPCCTSLSASYAFDDSISLLEQLCKIQKTVNEIIINLNDINSNFEEIEKLINTLEEQINNISDEFITFKAEITSEFTEFKNSVNNQIETALKEFKIYTDSQISILKFYIDSEITKLNNKIAEIEIGDINVLNPVNGKVEKIDIVLRDIYNQTRTGAITAGEYETLQLTAQVYEEKQLTAYQYDNNGKNLLN